MQVTDVLRTARDAITVTRVYAEPYEKDGVTIIPAAVLGGGAAGGGGRDEKGQEGEGGGFGVTGRPVGAFVIKDGQVSWRPVVDPSRVITMVGLAVIAYVLSRPRLVRARSSSPGRRARV